MEERRHGMEHTAGTLPLEPHPTSHLGETVGRVWTGMGLAINRQSLPQGGTSSGKTPPPKASTPLQNSSTNQGTNIQTYESLGNISHSKHNRKYVTLSLSG